MHNQVDLDNRFLWLLLSRIKTIKSNISYRQYDQSDKEGRKQCQIELVVKTSVPQIFINNIHIGS